MRVVSCSYSSDRKLARCEQQFSYRYDEKLKLRVKKKGLYMGEWLHCLREAYYRKQDWKAKFKELKKTLWDNLFEEERDKYEEDGFTPAIAFELMEHYVEHWGGNDKKWKVLLVEEGFELQTKYGFPIRWKSDLIVQDGRSKILVENKNKKAIPDSAERIMAPQVHGYCFLLSKKGIKIDRILWDYIRTEPVPRPQVLKNGNLSERKINTDRRSYLAAMKEAKIHPKGDEVIGVENFLATLPETLTLARIGSIPNLLVGEKFVRDWVERHRRATGIERPTRHYVKSCSWECDYYDLCQIDLLGKDRSTYIKQNFVPLKTLVEENPNAE